MCNEQKNRSDVKKEKDCVNSCSDMCDKKIEGNINHSYFAVFDDLINICIFCYINFIINSNKHLLIIQFIPVFKKSLGAKQTVIQRLTSIRRVNY